MHLTILCVCCLLLKEVSREERRRSGKLVDVSDSFLVPSCGLSAAQLSSTSLSIAVSGGLLHNNCLRTNDSSQKEFTLSHIVDERHRLDHCSFIFVVPNATSDSTLTCQIDTSLKSPASVDRALARVHFKLDLIKV